jgi:hypothetical protein
MWVTTKGHCYYIKSPNDIQICQILGCLIWHSKMLHFLRTILLKLDDTCLKTPESQNRCLTSVPLIANDSSGVATFSESAISID